MSPEERAKALRDGERAAELWEALPWESLEASIKNEWSTAKSAEAREALWNELQGLNRLKSRLMSMGQNAKVAAMEMDLEKRKADPYVHA